MRPYGIHAHGAVGTQAILLSHEVDPAGQPRQYQAHMRLCGVFFRALVDDQANAARLSSDEWMCLVCL
jgi:hypothetical protein